MNLLKSNIRNELVSSFANGPGNRYVVWFQGCPHGCVGCYNPGSWSTDVNQLVESSVLVERILASGCTGVTFTGGEPMSQPAGFLEVLQGLHSDGVLDAQLVDGIILFTGHEPHEIAADVLCVKCLDYVDLAICGRFVRASRAVQGLMGSTNQCLRWLDRPGRGKARISEVAVATGQVFEAQMLDGGVVLTGFPDVEGLRIPGVVRKRV